MCANATVGMSALIKKRNIHTGYLEARDTAPYLLGN